MLWPETRASGGRNRPHACEMRKQKWFNKFSNIEGKSGGNSRKSKIFKIFKIFRIFRWKNRRKIVDFFWKFIFRFGARKMRCGMCLSTHRASLKKVWETFYVGEIFYPLSKSKIEGKSGGNSRIFWIFQIFRWKIVEKKRKHRRKIFFQKCFSVRYAENEVRNVIIYP